MSPNGEVASPSPGNDDDLKHVNPGFPKAAAGFTLLAGGLGILTGLQTLLLTVRIFSPFWIPVPYVLVALGAALVVLSRSVFIARPWAAIAAIGVEGLLAVASGAWLVFAVTNGFIALYAIWTPALSLLAAGLSGAAIAPCRRAERVRARLRAEGMSLGL